LHKYKYNEEEYAKEIKERGFLTKYHTYELKILAKYYKSEGYKPKERKELLYAFCEKYIEKFNKVKYFKVINSALNYAKKKKNKLIIIDEIPIFDTEIEYINGLQLDYVYKKVLFTLLVKNKINKQICELTFGKSSEFNFFGGKKQHYQEIYEMAKIPSEYKINNIINYLSEQGLVDIRTRGRINLLFIDYIEQSDNEVMKITTFDNVGYYLDWYNGDKKIIQCENCGKFIKKYNSRKYCKSCAKEMNIKKTIENRKKLFENENVSQ
jgi:hypothetical protein